METEQLVREATRIRDEARTKGALGALVEARELTRTYGGVSNSFYALLQQVDQKWSPDRIARDVVQALDGFIRFVSAGLVQGISVERQAQIDVVSDILEQAQTLLESRDTHPAASAVLIGAGLEEFLRNWVEEQGLRLESRKPGIESYSAVLREAGMLSKQDAKDITAWAGTRNHAAHGEWDEVGDRSRVRLMLEGVNLFMRQHTPTSESAQQ